MKLGRTSAAIVAAAAGCVLAASAAPAVSAPHARSVTIATPKLTITMSKGGVFKVVGPRRFSAGRVDLTLHARKGEQEFEILRLHKGYTLAQLGKDFNTCCASQGPPTKAGLKALNRIVRRTTFLGGLDSGTGHVTVSGSVVLGMATTYYLLDDSNGPSGNVPPVKLHVSAKAGSRATPAFSASQRAITAKRFRGTTHLPASGTVEFTNDSTSSPHFMVLQHVKKGTTRKQVIKSFQSNSQGPPSFIRTGTVATDVVGMGKSMTITYTLPKGDYAEMCFFPDLKTGMPHAFMGMVRIVHLA